MSNSRGFTKWVINTKCTEILYQLNSHKIDGNSTLNFYESSDKINT